ncbi:MAG: hypothetical protein ACK4IT_00180 [Thioalkalivibrionaceae bacterium]
MPAIEDAAPRWIVWLGVAPRSLYEALIGTEMQKRGVVRPIDDPSHTGSDSGAQTLDKGTTNTPTEQVDSTHESDVWAIRLSVDAAGRLVPGSLDIAPIWLWLAKHDCTEKICQTHDDLCLSVEAALVACSDYDNESGRCARDTEATNPNDAHRIEPMHVQPDMPLRAKISQIAGFDITTFNKVFQNFLLDSVLQPSIKPIGPDRRASKKARRSLKQLSKQFAVAVADWTPERADRVCNKRLHEVKRLAQVARDDVSNKAGGKDPRTCLLCSPVVQRLVHRPQTQSSLTDPSASEFAPGALANADPTHALQQKTPERLFHALAKQNALRPGSWRPLEGLLERHRILTALAVASRPGGDRRTRPIRNHPREIFEAPRIVNGWPLQVVAPNQLPRPPLLIVSDDPRAVRDRLIAFSGCPRLSDQARIAIFGVPSIDGSNDSDDDLPHPELSLPSLTVGEKAKSGVANDAELVTTPSHTANSPTNCQHSIDPCLQAWRSARDAMLASAGYTITSDNHQNRQTVCLSPFQERTGVNDATASDASERSAHLTKPSLTPGSTDHRGKQQADKNSRPNGPLSDDLRSAYERIVANHPELRTFAHGVAYRLAPIEKSLRETRKTVDQLEQRLQRRSRQWSARVERLRKRLHEIEGQTSLINEQAEHLAEQLNAEQNRKCQKWLDRLTSAIGLRSARRESRIDCISALHQQLQDYDAQLKLIAPIERRARGLIVRCQTKRHQERAEIEAHLLDTREKLAREQTRFRAVIERQKDRFMALRNGDRSVVPPQWPPEARINETPVQLAEIDDIQTIDGIPNSAAQKPHADLVCAVPAQIDLADETVVAEQPQQSDRRHAPTGSVSQGKTGPLAPATFASSKTPDRHHVDDVLDLTEVMIEPLQRLNQRVLAAHLSDPFHHPLEREHRLSLWRSLALTQPVIIVPSHFARQHLSPLGDNVFEHVVIDMAETRSPADISLLSRLGVTATLRLTGRDHQRWSDVSIWCENLLQTLNDPPEKAEPAHGPRMTEPHKAKIRTNDLAQRSPSHHTREFIPNVTPSTPGWQWIDSGKMRANADTRSSTNLGLVFKSSEGHQHHNAADLIATYQFLQSLEMSVGPEDSSKTLKIVITSPFKIVRKNLDKLLGILDLADDIKSRITVAKPNEIRTMLAPSQSAAQAVSTTVIEELPVTECSHDTRIIVVLGSAWGQAGAKSRLWAAAGQDRLRCAMASDDHAVTIVGDRSDWLDLLNQDPTATAIRQEPHTR